jgi:hypothetical protein
MRGGLTIPFDRVVFWITWRICVVNVGPRICSWFLPFLWVFEFASILSRLNSGTVVVTASHHAVPGPIDVIAMNMGLNSLKFWLTVKTPAGF